MRNSIFTSARARLCHSTHKVGKLRGGRQQRTVRARSGNVLPTDVLQARERTWSAPCTCTFSLQQDFAVTLLLCYNLHGFTSRKGYLVYVYLEEQPLSCCSEISGVFSGNRPCSKMRFTLNDILVVLKRQRIHSKQWQKSRTKGHKLNRGSSYRHANELDS